MSPRTNASGALIVITDPLNNLPFPQNMIPASRINGWGQAILNFFPLPNTTFPAGTPLFRQANFQQAGSGAHPRRNDIVRIDANVNRKLNAYFRFGQDWDTTEAIFQGINFLKGIQDRPNPGHGYVGSANHTISPTLMNQFTYGYTMNTAAFFEINPSQVDRALFKGAPGSAQAGQPLPSLFPLPTPGPGVGGNIMSGPAKQTNGYSPYLPSVGFGTTPPNTPSFSIGIPEYANANIIHQVSDNVNKISGPHNFKAGVYIEFNRKIQAGGTGYLGNYNFGPDSNNPLNTGNGFANALLGNFTSYSESTARKVLNVTYWNVEFYVQDNWRITKKLSLGAFTDGWNISGGAAFLTGAPFTPGFSTTNGLDITGSPNEGARIDVVGNPFANVPTGRYFNPAAFAEPAVRTIGNAGTNIMYGPGTNNFDMTLSRSVPIGLGENRLLKFRLEAFNAFNHTEFSGVNSGFIFNASGVNTSATTGAFTSTRGPRIMALELRFEF